MIGPSIRHVTARVMTRACPPVCATAVPTAPVCATRGSGRGSSAQIEMRRRPQNRQHDALWILGEAAEMDEGSDGEGLPRRGRARMMHNDHHEQALLDDLDSGSQDSEVEELDFGTGDVKVTFHDDQGAQNAYEEFKTRASRKRKKQAAVRRKAKMGKGTGIGKRHELQGIGRIEPRAYGDVNEDDDDIDSAIPAYLMSRRQKFDDKQRDRLNQAGLFLPPTFEDVDFSDDDQLERLGEKPRFPGTEPKGKYKDIVLPYSLGVIPAPIAQWLKNYQVEGTQFLHELFVYQKGGILGDDMGLGKTIQVIACLTAAFGKTGDERDAKRMRKMRKSHHSHWYPRVMVICPSGLLSNWESELQRWGWWHTGRYHGSPSDKEAVLQAARQGRLEIMLTTYNTYRLNKEEINLIEWDCVIADECHIAKERTSLLSMALCEVNSLCRIGLTGTAMQNKYEEFWTLLNWTNPGRFGPISTWNKVISEPLKIGQSHDATAPQLKRARETANKLVKNLLPEFFLRRTKALIAHELPKKRDQVVFCPLTDTQAEAYENYVASDIVEGVRYCNLPCDCGSGRKQGWCCRTLLEDGSRWQNHVFPAMITLQKLSNHLALLIPSAADGSDKQSKDIATLQLSCPENWRSLYSTRDSILNYANHDFCGKWKVLSKLLKFWYDLGDNKVLVFSHSVRLLRMLQTLFSTTSYNVSYLDGSMSIQDRAAAVDEFNSDPQQFVFLISTRAGGIGLNITSANKVVVMDPNWNPSYDLQAQDRAYRLGQTRDVDVFRLVSAGTIEEIVYARQIYKQQQANIGYNASTERRYFKGVQDQKDMKGEIFGLANLFAFQSENVVLRDIVNKTNVAEARAGISMAGLDFESQEEADPDGGWMKMDEEEKADAAMKELAALVSQGKDEDPFDSKPRAPSKTNAINAILRDAGVSYTHENSEVIGSSKIESRLSKRAQEAAVAPETATEHVFASSQPEDLDASEDLDDDTSGEATTATTTVVKKRRTERKKYNPPEDVRKRQFVAIAEHFGYTNVTEFALLVESWTQAQRRECLEKFYQARKDALENS